MRAPNLVLLTIECWRADHFGRLTPNLLRLADESVVFAEAQAAGGWTKISMTALMSSAYASMHGGPRIALGTPRRTTLAECLLEKGYWSAGFTANPVCGVIGGFHRGFCEFREVRREIVLPPDAPRDWKRQWSRLLDMGIPPRDAQPYAGARQLTDLGLGWLERRGAGEPFFLWLHYLDPHWPCQMASRPAKDTELRDAWLDVDTYRNRVVPSRGRYDPGEEARERWVRRYWESVESADNQIGRLLEALRARADCDRTIIAVTGDHGEEFFERGTWHHSWNQLHREGVHVPLILRAPGIRPQTITAPVGHLDLAPTLLSLAGIRPPESMMGTDLFTTSEEKPCPDRPVFTEMMGHLDSNSYTLCIRDSEWKYIYDLDDPHNSKLFRVSDDPGEMVNVRDRYGAIFRDFERLRLAHTSLGMTSLMERRRDAAQPESYLQSPNCGHADADPIMREQLEALGYL